MKLSEVALTSHEEIPVSYSIEVSIKKEKPPYSPRAQEEESLVHISLLDTEYYVKTGKKEKSGTHILDNHSRTSQLGDEQSDSIHSILNKMVSEDFKVNDFSVESVDKRLNKAYEDKYILSVYKNPQTPDIMVEHQMTEEESKTFELIGFAYIDQKAFSIEFGEQIMDEELEAQADWMIEKEVEQYSSYLNSDTYLLSIKVNAKIDENTISGEALVSGSTYPIYGSDSVYNDMYDTLRNDLRNSFPDDTARIITNRMVENFGLKLGENLLYFTEGFQEKYYGKEDIQPQNEKLGKLCEEVIFSRVSENFNNYVSDKEISEAISKESGILISDKMQIEKMGDSVLLMIKGMPETAQSFSVEDLIERAENEELILRKKLEKTAIDEISNLLVEGIEGDDYSSLYSFMNDREMFKEEISLAVKIMPSGDEKEYLNGNTDWNVIEIMSEHAKKSVTEKYLTEGEIEKAVSLIARENLDISNLNVDYIESLTRNDNIQSISGKELTEMVEKKLTEESKTTKNKGGILWKR